MSANVMLMMIFACEIFITAIAIEQSDKTENLAHDPTSIDGNEETRENIPKKLHTPFGAAIFDLDSFIFLCNGVLYSPVFVFTSCRCLCSGIATEPHYVKRNASRYGLNILFRKDDPGEQGGERQMDDQNGIRVYIIESFILHPYCFRTLISKPYRKHFGLVVLKGSGIQETVHQLAIFGRSLETEESAKTLTTCRIVGLHTDDGRLVLKETEMVIITSSDCLWRLCTPGIGCDGRDSDVSSRQELCMTTAGDKFQKLRIYEGSEIMCNGEDLGVIVSTGRIRYPDAPVVLASIQQFVDNMPNNFLSQENGSSKTLGIIHGTYCIILELTLTQHFFKII